MTQEWLHDSDAVLLAEQHIQMREVGTMGHQTIELYQEPCDCNGRVMHNNGGNYHEVVNVHTFASEIGSPAWCVVLETTTTREGFPRESLDSLLETAGRFELVPREQVDDDELDDEIARFRRGEAEIIAQS
jgi:hypothetical protein